MAFGDAPVVSPEEEWRARLAAGELSFQRCADCSAAVFYPRMVCPGCGSDGLLFETSRGAGSVYSTTTVHGRSGDRNVVLVDVDEGFRMMSTVRGIPSARVNIGQRVRFEVADDGDAPLAVFVPCEGGLR